MSVCIKPNWNILDVDLNVINPVTEVITLNEVKAHLNLAFETEGSFEFDDDDSYLTALITVVRAAMEKYTGCSIVERTVSLVFSYQKGKFEFPYGPVREQANGNEITLTDKDGEAIENAYFRGLSFMWYDGPVTDYAFMTYEAGYGSGCPPSLKRAMLEEIAFRYKNRGDSSDINETKLSQGARAMAFPFKRKTWLL